MSEETLNTERKSISSSYEQNTKMTKQEAPNTIFTDWFWQGSSCILLMIDNHFWEGQLTFQLIHQISPTPCFGFKSDTAQNHTPPVTAAIDHEGAHC